MIKKWLNLRNILIFSFLLSVFLLALTKTHDFDAWIHLTMGKLIWTLKGFPGKEPFLYTIPNNPFEYSSWFFGVVYYLAYKLFDTYGVILLKASTITLSFYILLKDSLINSQESQAKSQEPAPASLRQGSQVMSHASRVTDYGLIIAIFVLTITAILTRPRFVERPDTFLMVFLPFSIYAINAYLYQGKRYIYALPFVHLLWANSHSSINLMFVPFGAAMVSLIINRFINSSSSSNGFKSSLKFLLLIFVLSFGAALLNPNFIGQFTFGAQFLKTEWFKQEIVELQPPTWEIFKYHFIFMGIVVLSFISSFISSFIKKRLSDPSFLMPFIQRLLLIMPFIYLSFTARRFILIFVVVLAPVFIKNLVQTVQTVQTAQTVQKVLTVFLLFWIVFYTSFLIANIHPFRSDVFRFGFGFNYINVPEGALRYMDKRGIIGRMLNQFQYGQYIIWRDFPKRQPFVDGRGNIPPDLLEKRGRSLYDTALMDSLFMRYGFDSVLITYPPYNPDASLYKDDALTADGWALVYWDDNSLLYLKRGLWYDNIIKEDEYRYILPANPAEQISARINEPGYAEVVARELKRNTSETGSYKGYYFLGTLYINTGFHEKAVVAFKNALKVEHKASALYGLGYAYYMLGDIENAIRYYKKSISMQKGADIFHDLSLAYLKKGQRGLAIHYLKKAVKINPDMPELYPEIIKTYMRLGKTKEADRFKDMYNKALAKEKSRKHIQKGQDALNMGRVDEAIREYEMSLNTMPNPTAYNKLAVIYLNSKDYRRALNYLKSALELEPDFADAHYNLGELYKELGQNDLSDFHYRQYLRLKPTGYYARELGKKMRLMEINGDR